MVNFNKINTILLATIFSVSIVACEEEEDYTIPVSDVEVVIPESAVVEVTEIQIGEDNPAAVAMGGAYTITALTPAGVDKVEFYNNGELLGEDVEAPFTWDLTTFGEHNIVAKGYSSGIVSGEDNAAINILYARYPVSMGTLVGDGNEVFNSDGPDGENYPQDNKYAAMINVAGELSVASGVNIPVIIPEAGDYLVSMGLASGHVDAESYVRFYFDQDEPGVQRSAAVPPDGWLAFADYELPQPYTLTAGEHVAKVRFGGPWVHIYYVDIYPAAGQ